MESRLGASVGQLRGSGEILRVVTESPVPPQFPPWADGEPGFVLPNGTAGHPSQKAAEGSVDSHKPQTSRSL